MSLLLVWAWSWARHKLIWNRQGVVLKTLWVASLIAMVKGSTSLSVMLVINKGCIDMFEACDYMMENWFVISVKLPLSAVCCLTLFASHHWVLFQHKVIITWPISVNSVTSNHPPQIKHHAHPQILGTSTQHRLDWSLEQCNTKTQPWPVTYHGSWLCCNNSTTYN